MNQKSSLREDPNFVSWVLTANMHLLPLGCTLTQLLCEHVTVMRKLSKSFIERALGHTPKRLIRKLIASEKHTATMLACNDRRVHRQVCKTRGPLRQDMCSMVSRPTHNC